jgi:hypothetical protein
MFKGSLPVRLPGLLWITYLCFVRSLHHFLDVAVLAHPSCDPLRRFPFCFGSPEFSLTHKLTCPWGLLRFSKGQKFIFPITLTGATFSRLCPSWHEGDGEQVSASSHMSSGDCFCLINCAVRTKNSSQPSSKGQDMDSFALSSFLSLLYSSRVTFHHPCCLYFSLIICHSFFFFKEN